MNIRTLILPFIFCVNIYAGGLESGVSSYYPYAINKGFIGLFGINVNLDGYYSMYSGGRVEIQYQLLRYFDDGTLEQLQKIRSFRREHKSLAEIKELLA